MTHEQAYEIIGPIGSGGMVELLLCADTTPDERTNAAMNICKGLLINLMDR